MTVHSTFPTWLVAATGSAKAELKADLILNRTTEVRGSLGEISGTHVSDTSAICLQTMVPLSEDDAVDLQDYFRGADRYFAADYTTFWGTKIGEEGRLTTVPTTRAPDHITLPKPEFEQLLETADKKRAKRPHRRTPRRRDRRD